jgi:ATP diphosphatase
LQRSFEVFILGSMTNQPTTPIQSLLEIMARLRDPAEGCPWDVEQTFETIAPYTLEEAYEVDHAIRTGDMESLCDELGDLLLQVVFHAQMAAEAGHFAFDDVANAICDKLIRRHPHVFGDPERLRTAQEQTSFWEESKAQERASRAEARGGPPDPFEGIPTALPSLTRAVKLKKRAARLTLPEAAMQAGTTQEPGSAFDLSRLDTALDDLVGESSGALNGDPENAPMSQQRARQCVGRLLQRCVDAARALGVDPEDALREANFDFEARVNQALALGKPAEAKRS